MRNLPIAYGNSRQAKTWVNKTTSFTDLKERLKVPIRTSESAEEYAKMTKADRDNAKDHGGFVFGSLIGGRRTKNSVAVRSGVCLDGDRITQDFLDSFEDACPYAAALYTTHSHTEEKPRVRVAIPAARDMTPEEFVAVSRFVAQEMGIDQFDECSYLPNQLMYYPSTPANGVFVYKETGPDKEWLDPDKLLAAHPEWTDPMRLPTSSRESKANTASHKKVQDPMEKKGVVGLFNRAFYPIQIALQKFLPDVYEPTDNDNRWHLIESSSMPGVEVIEDKFVYFRYDEIFHVPGLGFNGLVGFSPIAMMKNSLGTTLAVEKYGSSFFRNGAQPSGVLEHPGVLKNPEKIRENWSDVYGGANNAHKVAVLEEGMQYKAISLPPEDSQFLSTRQFGVNEICRIFRVPPHMVQDLEHATFSNIEHQSIDFVVHTLTPWLVRFEQAIVKDLLLPDEQDEYFPKFNVDGLLRGDYQSRMQGYATGISNGFLSPNDIHRLENMDLIPAEKGGDDYYLNGGYVKLEDAGKAVKQAESTPDNRRKK